MLHHTPFKFSTKAIGCNHDKDGVNRSCKDERGGRHTRVDFADCRGIREVATICRDLLARDEFQVVRVSTNLTRLKDLAVEYGALAKKNYSGKSLRADRLPLLPGKDIKLQPTGFQRYLDL